MASAHKRGCLYGANLSLPPTPLAMPWNAHPSPGRINYKEIECSVYLALQLKKRKSTCRQTIGNPQRMVLGSTSCLLH